MKLLRKLVTPLLLALVAGVSAHAEDPTAELMETNLPPGVYKAYYLGNPFATYPCGYVPANSCLIIVRNKMGQSLMDDKIGPVISVKQSSDPAWRWEATTKEENTMYMESTSDGR